MREDRWRLGDHHSVAYATDDECRDEIVGFVRHGVAVGRRVVVFLDRDQVDLARTLTAAVPDAVPGQFLVLRYGIDFGGDPDGAPFTVADMLAGLTVLHDTTFADGHPALAVVGQMTWALRAGFGPADLVEYETQANSVFGGDRVAAICLYNRRVFSRQALAEIGVVHPGPLLRFTLGGHGADLRLIGEVDASNGRSLPGILALVPADADADATIVLDAAELQFVDAAGAGAIVRFAASRPARPTVVRCTREVGQALRLVGADAVPSLLLRDRVTRR